MSFNGKRDDDETGTQDYGMRIYNPNLGKFLSVDPLTMEYPYLTPYQFASNSPIAGIDLDGLEILDYRTPYRLKLGKTQLTYDMTYSWSDDAAVNEQMRSTAVKVAMGLKAKSKSNDIPLSVNIIPLQDGLSYSEAQKYMVISDADILAESTFGTSYDPDGAESNTMSGAAANKKKGERYIKTQTNKNIAGKGEAAAQGINWFAKLLYWLGGTQQMIDAKRDVNTMIDAYRNATSYVDKVWDFSNAAKDWNWAQKDVDQFRIDVINFVADGKLPNGQSKEYGASVTSYGVEVMQQIKAADAKIKLKSE